MKIQLSAACLILTLVALSSEAATTRAVRIDRGTFRAVARSQSASPAAAPTTVSFSAPANNVVSQASNFSQPGRGFTPVGNSFGQAGRGASTSNNRFANFRTSWSTRRAADPEPAPAEGPQPVSGALIRTAGSGYTVTAGGPVGMHAVDGGSQFVHEKAGGQALEGPGLRQGAPDSGDTASSQGTGNGTVSSPLGSALSK